MARINMTTTETSTTHQGPSFDDLLDAIRDVEECAELDHMVNQLRAQGVRFPKALVDALMYYFGRELEDCVPHA